MFLEISGQHFLYADDIAMLHHGSSNEDLKEMMEHDFNTISTWTSSNKLSINNAIAARLCFGNARLLRMRGILKLFSKIRVLFKKRESARPL
jgi:hypothetical protein